MQITLHHLAKKYNNKWLFSQLDFIIEEKAKLAIIGKNGSGKSSLLKIIAGLESFSKGSLNYKSINLPVEFNNTYFTFSAPYINPIEDFSTLENLQFAQTFKPFRNKLTVNEVFNLLPEDKRHPDKPLKELSSGMVQRVKLLLAILPNVGLVLLDEPTSNLDNEGVEWYKSMVAQFLEDTTVLVGSNHKEEYSFCTQFIEMGALPLPHGIS